MWRADPGPGVGPGERCPPRRTDPGCPDAELFSGKLITDICWACLFPVRIAGIPIGGGQAPSGATNQIVCACNDALGVPHPGFTIGMWEPARIVELVHSPRCSPALGGIRLPLGSRRLLGTVGQCRGRLPPTAPSTTTTGTPFRC